MNGPGILIKTNARHAAQVAALLSPTRSFIPVDRGSYFMAAATDTQALRDYDFIVSTRLVSPSGITLLEGAVS